MARSASSNGEVKFRGFLAGSSTTHYSLGRPQAPVFALNAKETEGHVARLVALCEERLEVGGVVRVSGDSSSEASLYTVLSLAATRLRKRGRSVTVSGSPFLSSEIPPVPDACVAILLESMAYEYADQWIEATPGRVTVLVGRLEHCDLSVRATCPSEIHLISKPILNDLLDVWSAQLNSLVGNGLLLCAAGVDLPPGYFSAELPPPPFVPVKTPSGEKTEWHSIPGIWLARQALTPEIHFRGLERLSTPISAYPDLLRRLARVWRSLYY